MCTPQNLPYLKFSLIKLLPVGEMPTLEICSSAWRVSPEALHENVSHPSKGNSVIVFANILPAHQSSHQAPHLWKPEREEVFQIQAPLSRLKGTCAVYLREEMSPNPHLCVTV